MSGFWTPKMENHAISLEFAGSIIEEKQKRCERKGVLPSWREKRHFPTVIRRISMYISKYSLGMLTKKQFDGSKGELPAIHNNQPFPVFQCVEVTAYVMIS